MSWIIYAYLFFSCVYAETELDAIEVNASKDIERFTFSSSNTIQTNELEKDPMGLIAPVIEKVPGVVTVQDGGPGGRTTFFIRGTESRHLSFTLDGLKLNDPSSNDRQFDSAFMMSPFIKEITVYKGPQAVLYGSDAFGGLIEIKSRRGENAPETRFTLSGGSFGTIDSSLSKDWATKNNNGSLTVSQFHTDGISRLNKKRHNAKEKDSTDITQLTSSSEHRWASKFQTDLLASYLHGKAEQDGLTDNNHDYSENDQYLLQQKTNYELSSLSALSLRNGLNRHQRHNESLSSNSEFFDGEIIQNELLYRWDNHRFATLAGLSNEQESAKAKQMDKSFDLNSAFLQGSYTENHFKFHVGMRADHHSKYGSFYTGSSGIGFYDFTFQYSQGYKAPSLYQLYGPDYMGQPVGNDNLEPETNHSWELGWRKKEKDYETGITLFQNRLSNQFVYVWSEGYFNQSRYIAEGIELDGKIASRLFQVSASFTHQNFREEESPVLRRPYNFGQISLSYFPRESWELNVIERWFDSRKDFNDIKLNGYEVTDVAIRKIWERDDVALQVKNIFDREYENIYGFSVMPRSLFLHYGHQFQ